MNLIYFSDIKIFGNAKFGPEGDAPLMKSEQEPKIPHSGILSPIIEVASSNISPNLVSPLTTPKVHLTIPETSKSDHSVSPVTPDKTPEKKHKSPPKTVAFADLPLLLRLRSPTMRFKIPNYRSKWQENLRTDSVASTSEDDVKKIISIIIFYKNIIFNVTV